MILIKSILIKILEVFFEIYFAVLGKPKIDSELAEVLELYKDGNDFKELFSTIRVWDTPYDKIEQEISESGKIVDLGCGEGILANYIALKSSKRKVHGIELNASRVKDADKGMKNAQFEIGDIRKTTENNISTALLVHVLHHLPSYADQETVLKNVFANLKKGGKLVVVEIAETPLPKYWFTWVIDTVVVPILFEGKLIDQNINYRSARDWKKALKDIGFTCKVTKIDDGKPFSHILLTCEKL